MESIAANYAHLLGEIARAAERAGRDPAEIQLVAVSKTISPERIREAFAAGVRTFAENRAQDFRDKRRALNDLPIRWHFVGTLQTNKVRYVTPAAALIHSVDRLDLARHISTRAAATRPQPILVQVNTTGEETKSGISLSALPALLDELALLPHLDVAGLMTIGPLTDDPRAITSAFRALRAARDREAAVGRPGMPLRHLSMGMSGDFPLAIAEGATLIRVGTALFGARD